MQNQKINLLHEFIHLPKHSEWYCYMFGNKPGGTGIVYRPLEKNVPNAFVRYMMKICFGCTWIKRSSNAE